MIAARIIKSRGILNPKVAETKFQISRHLPADDLSFFVERYWIINWNLREPYIQETLPYPCLNLVFERGNTRVFGIERAKSSRLLEGEGRVFGIKFRPGAFYPFIKSPVSRLTDRSISFPDVFGFDCTPLEQALLSLTNECQMIALVEHFLREHLPERDETVELINAIIDCIIEDRAINKVDDIAARLSLSKRTLQRLFSQYVGVSPKWVIKRSRLHEAAEQLAHGNAVDLPRMALDLGYFDQAHFIKDFKTIVGLTPLEYARSIINVAKCIS